jgi:hypothetical protein
MLFTCGEIATKSEAAAKIAPESIEEALLRHAMGDWGDLDSHDARSNRMALQGGGRLLSVYHDKNGTQFWIVTEPSRSETTVLLPEECDPY